ncbi:MAG: transposase [Crocinitomicaceae bacterium]|nr:transposase [Crocinitomicaceae bacterium]
MRMDILLFLGYDIDEPLPWHSTISRTRQLFPEDLFEKVFTQVLSMCIEKGMVSGHTQAIDSAPVKANASMDSLELKVPEQDLSEHLQKIRHANPEDEPRRKSKEDKSDDDQRKLKASDSELNSIENRNKNWSDKGGDRPGHNHKSAKYTSNKTHYSPTYPDARISVKPGKSRKLNYLSQMSVDTANHVITDIGSDFADQKDSQHLQKITLRLRERLWRQGVLMHCKSSFHYKKKLGEKISLFETIDKQLKTNRRLLKLFNKAGKAVVRKDELIVEGFNPKYFTHYWKNSKGGCTFFAMNLAS